MKSLVLTTSLVLLLAAGSAWAGDDCHDPVASWQPRENLRQMLEQHGWQVRRIRVDDGCYEVRGRDRSGNRVEAKYAPASLRIRSLEVEFDDDADTSAYPDLPAMPR